MWVFCKNRYVKQKKKILNVQNRKNFAHTECLLSLFLYESRENYHIYIVQVAKPTFMLMLIISIWKQGNNSRLLKEESSHALVFGRLCKKGGPVYVKGLKWFVRNGEKVKVQNDFWLPMGTLRTLIEGPLNRDEDLITLNHCFDQNHEW